MGATGLVLSLKPTANLARFPDDPFLSATENRMRDFCFATLKNHGQGAGNARA